MMLLTVVAAAAHSGATLLAGSSPGFLQQYMGKMQMLS